MSNTMINLPVGNGVLSLNGLIGALTLVGGSGITITPSGTSITISSTALMAAITSINSDTTAAQTLSVGTSGTNFAIVDAGGGSHIFNLPTASSSNRGALSSADWSTFNNKQSALTFGNLTDAGTDGITITNGTGAVIGSGTSISQHVADAIHNGYLSSTDWSTFNSKQTAGNYITALTGDGAAAGPGSAALTLATVNANVGSFGSSTAIPSFTVNAKGLITAASTNAVIAPAGTLTGTTLASNVVSSSLTSVGTITSGTWNGSVITPPYGGAPPVTRNLFVDGSRTDTYTADGSFGRPFTTIMAAVSQVITNNDNATHPYTITVAPFAYSENLTFNSSTLYNLTIAALVSGITPLPTTTTTGLSVTSLSSTSNNTQLGTLIFIGMTFNGNINLIGDVNGTNFGSSEVLFSNCQFNNSSGTIVLNNVNNVNFYACQIQGSGSVSTFTNVAFAYVQGVEGFISGTTLNLVQNDGGNQPSQSTGNYLLFSEAKCYAAVTIDAGSEMDTIQTYFGSGSTLVNNGTIHSWSSAWNGTLTLNNGSTTRFQGDILLNAPTVNAGATLSERGIIYANSLVLANPLAIAQGGTGSATTSAHFAFIGPTSGSGAPSFRALVAGDIPSLPYASSTLTNTHLFVGNASNVATDVALSGDATLANTGALTLATVNANVGTFASVTVNAKGLVTAATALSGDATTSGAALTLATVNTNVGTFASVTVNGKGLVTAATALSGDATTSGAALTLATVNTNTGSFGSSTAIPNFTVNGKGLITAAGTNAVIAPAGTLTGTTLASNVVSSSLTSVGTITSGTWTGTTIAVANGGTGQTSYTDGQLLIGNTTGNTLTKATLTAGSNITITNGNGSISIAASAGTPTFSGLRYHDATATVSSSPSTLTYSTSDFDTASAYSSGVFTAPTTGYYLVTAKVTVTATYAINNTAQLRIQVNGSGTYSSALTYAGGAQTNATVAISDTVHLTATNTITIQILSTATGPTINAAAANNTLSIAYLGV